MNKDSREISLAKEEIIKRYCFLYEHSFFILMQILFEHQNNLKDVCDDIKRVTSLSLDNQIPYERVSKFSNHISMFHLVEEYLFGDYRSNKTELEKVIFDMRYKSSAYLKSKMDYMFTDKKYGVNRKDVAMQVLVELMSDFIKSQNDYTVIIERGPHRLIYKGDSNRLTSSVVDKKAKAKGLDTFLDICKYRNEIVSKKHTRLLFNHQILGLSNRTLVMRNKFLFAFRDINFLESSKSIRDVYFKYHDEIPYDLEGVCKEKKDNIKRVVIKPCNKNFYINEDAVFYTKNSYLQICPKCGYIVNVSDSFGSEGVKMRIRDRYINDSNILYKENKLSELVSIDGIDIAKNLVKERK